ncbi:MAG: hypothetical protein ACFFBD_22410, partial [Candidatus Hodarchaeota archaeon]
NQIYKLAMRSPIAEYANLIECFAYYKQFNIFSNGDVTQCNEVQLGLLVQSILRLEQLGRGSNAGYGMLDVQEFELVERVITKRTKRVDNRYKVIKEVSEEPLYQEVEAALEVFKRYVSRS